MQYPIPQFIEEEGKIISFLTFRQFFWLVGGGAACILYYYILPFRFFAMASLLTAAIVVVIAFVKIDNVSLLTLLMHVVGFTVGTKNYTWKRKEATLAPKIQAKRQLTTIEEKHDIVPTRMQTSKLGDIKKLVETKR